MAEKFSENQFCRGCGANIRQGALFCYNCGTTVAQDVALETANEKQNEASNFWFRGEIQEGINENNSPKHVEAIEKPIGKTGPLQVEIEGGKNNKKLPTRQEPVKLKTAAAVRQKNRSAEGKQVEVIWEEPDSHVNVWFIIVSIILALFAVVVLLAMLYTR